MNIQISVLVSGISGLAACIAAFLSYKTFQRQKTFENENHFFKYKIEQYQLLVSNAYDTLDIYQEAIDDAEYIDSMDQKDVDSLIDEIDDKTNEFRVVMNKYSLFMPQEILDKLEMFYDTLNEHLGEDKISFEKLANEIDKFYTELTKIVNLMREDIGISALNSRLNKRIN